MTYMEAQAINGVMAASSAASHYDVAPDGQRFQLIEPPGASTAGTAPDDRGLGLAGGV